MQYVRCIPEIHGAAFLIALWKSVLSFLAWMRSRLKGDALLRIVCCLCQSCRVTGASATGTADPPPLLRNFMTEHGQHLHSDCTLASFTSHVLLSSIQTKSHSQL